MSIKQAILNRLGATPRNSFNEIDVKFYKDCLHEVPHGQIVVTNKLLKLSQVAVPFVFPGMSEPPVLTARLMQDIWSAAESQGYVPHHLLPLTYGLHQAEQAETDPTAESAAAAVIANLDRAMARRRTVDGAPSVRTLTSYPSATAVIAGVTTEDVDNFFATFWKSESTLLMIRNSLTLDQITAVHEMLTERVQKGFIKHEVFGDISDACKEILDTYLKGIGRSILSGSGIHLMGAKQSDVSTGGLPVALSTLRKQTTDDQQENMEALIDANVTAEQLAILTPVQVDELKSRVLMSVSNDQARNLEDHAVNANGLEVIRQFLHINLPKVELKFPRA